MKREIKTIILNTVFMTIMIAGFAFIVLIIQQMNHRAAESQAYSRFTACALSLEEDKRYEPEITKCWDKAEKQAGTTVERYNK